MTTSRDFDYDYIVVGSGFGGSVSGLRLTEKGYRVLMLEKGRELFFSAGRAGRRPQNFSGGNSFVVHGYPPPSLFVDPKRGSLPVLRLSPASAGV